MIYYTKIKFVKVNTSKCLNIQTVTLTTFEVQTFAKFFNGFALLLTN
jgi:hypothetical protein